MTRPAREGPGNYFFLLGGLCLLLLVVPVVSELMGPRLVFELELPVAGLLILGVWSLYDSKRSLYLGITLVAIAALGAAPFLEAVVGQFYIAVVVAALVGSYIAEHDSSEAESCEEERDP